VLSLCPECNSSNVKEAVYSPEEKHDGQGFWWQIIHFYYCEDCGCEWTETLTTTKEIEITKHGETTDTCKNC